MIAVWPPDSYQFNSADDFGPREPNTELYAHILMWFVIAVRVLIHDLSGWTIFEESSNTKSIMLLFFR